MAPKTQKVLDLIVTRHLSREDFILLEELESKWRFTFSQLKIFAGWMIDCRMWGEESFWSEFQALKNQARTDKNRLSPTQRARWLFGCTEEAYTRIRSAEKVYGPEASREETPKYRVEKKELKGRFYRPCPAFAPTGICCGLQVLNLIDNCAMACTYCVLQNHYPQAVIKIPESLTGPLQSLKLDPDKRYRIGTGEHSDSLLWGNRHNHLADLFVFAAAHPNIILELKTKSANVSYILENEVPRNICCSWTLNSPVIIAHEERKTPDLDARLKAARSVADKGVKVGLHLHPMVYYQGWQKDYTSVIGKVLDMFAPSEVLWFTLGCVTMVRGFDPHVHRGYAHSRILQMERELTPDNKETYPSPIRKLMYRNALSALIPWKGKVITYLCMEFADVWREVMGPEPADTAALIKAIDDSAFGKIN